MKLKQLQCPRCSQNLDTIDNDIAIFCDRCISVFLYGNISIYESFECLFFENPYLKMDLSLPFWRFKLDEDYDKKIDTVLSTIFVPAFDINLIILRTLTIGYSLGHFKSRVTPGTRLYGISITPEEAFSVANIFLSYSLGTNPPLNIKDYNIDVIGIPYEFTNHILKDQLIGLEIEMGRLNPELLKIWNLK